MGMQNLHQRAGDGLRGQVTKLSAGILSAFIVGAVGWNFSTLINLQDQLERERSHRQMIEYVLRYRGIDIPTQQWNAP
jgi:hypothetical protein